MINPNGLMMIEPSAEVSDKPLIDSFTRKMTAAWRNRKTSDLCYKGFHICRCLVTSDNQINSIDELETNSLAIHYLAWHRKEVPKTELDKINVLNYGEEMPTIEELCYPPNRKENR